MAKEKNDIQRQAFQLTFNHPKEHNYTHEEIKKILINEFPTLDYFAMVDEIGQEGTEHTHLYVHTTSRVRWSKYQNKFPGAHIEEAKGSAEQNLAYLKKSGKWADTSKAETTVPGTFEAWGTIPASKGGNPLMRELYKLVEDGYSTGEIIAINTDYIPYMDTIDRLRKMMLTEKYRGSRRLELRVHYVFGETGTGKTMRALDTVGDANAYRVTDYDHPYDSYEMQSVVIYDEFRSSLKITHMLDALDIYPLELPARYTNRIACYTTVYIISNWALEDQYKEVQGYHPSTWKAFLRRIHDVTYYNKSGNAMTFDSVADYFCAIAEKPLRDSTESSPEQLSQEDFDGLFKLVPISDKEDEKR